MLPQIRSITLLQPLALPVYCASGIRVCWPMGAEYSYWPVSTGISVWLATVRDMAGQMLCWDGATYLGLGYCWGGIIHSQY